MICPVCRRSMSPGYVPGGTEPAHWIPEGQKPSYVRFSVPPSAVRLKNKFSLFRKNGYYAEAHYCPACRIVIAPAE